MGWDKQPLGSAVEGGRSSGLRWEDDKSIDGSREWSEGPSMDSMVGRTTMFEGSLGVGSKVLFL